MFSYFLCYYPITTLVSKWFVRVRTTCSSSFFFLKSNNFFTVIVLLIIDFHNLHCNGKMQYTDHLGQPMFLQSKHLQVYSPNKSLQFLTLLTCLSVFSSPVCSPFFSIQYSHYFSSCKWKEIYVGGRKYSKKNGECWFFEGAFVYSPHYWFSSSPLLSDKDIWVIELICFYIKNQGLNALLLNIGVLLHHIFFNDFYYWNCIFKW